MPIALWALTVSAFAIGTTEFVIVGLIPTMAADLGVSLPSAGLLVSLYALSLPAVADYVAFMRVERTPYLHIRFDWLFSIYVVFAVAAILRHVWLAWRTLRGEAPEAFDPTKAGSGV